MPQSSRIAEKVDAIHDQLDNLAHEGDPDNEAPALEAEAARLRDLYWSLQ